MALTPEQQQLLNDLLEKNIQLEEKLAEYREKNIKDYENILSEEEKVVIEKSKKLELITQELDKIEFLSKEKLKQRGYTAETVKLLKQQAKELRGVEKQSEKIKQYTSSVADSAEDILGKYFGINSQTKKLGENLQKPLKYTGDIAKKVKEGLTATNLMGAAAAKFGEGMRAGLEYTKQTFGVMATIQKGQDLYDQMRLSARRVGVLSQEELTEYQGRAEEFARTTRFTAAEYTKGRETMFQTSNAFRQMLKGDQDIAINYAQTLERRLGVSAGTTAAQINDLTLAFGKTPEQANKAAASIQVWAKSMRMDASKVTTDFISQSNNLIKFGLPDMIGQFQGLATVQEKTGVSMDKVISTMDRFTTFEGALGAASKLNAVFGSTIDGMELMDVTMTEGPLKGFAKLREQMEASGMKIDDMNYAQFRVLQQQLGLTAKELKQLGNISVSEIQNIANKEPFMEMSDVLKELQKDQKGMETRSENLGKAQDTLRSAWQPQIDLLTELGKKFNNFLGSLAEAGPLLASGGAVIGGLAMLAGTLAKVASMMGAIPTAAANSGGALSGLAGKVTSLSGKMMGLAKAGIGVAGVFAGREIVKSSEGTAGKAAGALAGAAGGAYAGAQFGAMLGPKGALIGGALGGLAGGISTFFASGQNYISKPTEATVGERPEMISHRAQRMLGTGDRVSAANAGPTELKLTVNMVTKEGKVLETRQVNKTLDRDIANTVNHILDEKLNLIFS